MDLILYAIPFFLLLIMLELGFGVWRGHNTYRLNDTINSLSMGSLSRLQAIVVIGFSSSVYEFVVQRFQLQQLPDNEFWVWTSCFVLYDFAYYWKHRLGHEVALFWGSHVAHHQSEDFNLGTALRQTSIDFYGFLFYLPFFALGYPAEILFTVVSLNLIYQFWVHTEHVPKLGVFEWVFITPSNHRVHHGRNAIYVDKNYGGVFIIWDRLFGSFQEELEHEPVYFGLRKPLNSWNPLWANVHVYWRLMVDCWRVPGLLNKILLPFKRPGWMPEDMTNACNNKRSKDLSLKFDPQITQSAAIYTLVQFIITVALSLYTLIFSDSLGYMLSSFAVFYLAGSLYVHGLWLEHNDYATSAEYIRLSCMSVGVPTASFVFFPASFLTVCMIAGLYCALSAVSVFRISGHKSVPAT